MAEQPKVTPRGDLIRRLRAEQGFKTLDEFAKAVGLDVRLVRAAEKGKPSTVNTMVQIHAVLAIKKRGLEYGDLVLFTAGFGKEKNPDEVTEDEDIKPFLQFLLSQPNVDYAVFLRLRRGSVLIDIELTFQTIANVVIPAFDNGTLLVFDITALHLDASFVRLFAYEGHPIAGSIYSDTELFKSRLREIGCLNLDAMFLADGTAVVQFPISNAGASIA